MEITSHSYFVRCNGRHDFLNNGQSLFKTWFFLCLMFLNGIILYILVYVQSLDRPVVLYFTNYPIFAETYDVMADTILFKYTILFPNMSFILYFLGFAISWYTNIDIFNMLMIIFIFHMKK